MIHLDIPGRGPLALDHLLLDLNGTLALDGQLLPGVSSRLAALSSAVTIHLLTADTAGNAAPIADRLGIPLSRIKSGDEARQKQAFIEWLGADRVVAIGNGANDAEMLSAAALGIAVLGPEGLATAALRGADLVVSRVEDALDLLLYPRRLVATLRR
ncbi:MAG TPA: HAD family hydrolase [Anaerolineae bacterium]|nr:HAD family hydrolase [Anaerolineae bacterium]